MGHPLRVAAIRFLNPAPLMWDFEHMPRSAELATRYSLDWMMPSECAERLALPAEAPRAADLGLVPIAALATNRALKLVPGCAIASRHRVRSLLLVRRANQPLQAVRSVAADTSSRATLAYTQILFREWWQPGAGPEFRQHAPNLDGMLEAADAALLIGDPALMALEEQQARRLRSGEELIYHDLAAEWIALAGVPWVSAVWAVRETALTGDVTLQSIATDTCASRDHGLANVESLVAEWSARLPLSAETVRAYLTENIYYSLDEDCLRGMREFYRLAALHDVLPAYTL